MDDKALATLLAEFDERVPTLNELTPRLERLLHDLLGPHPFAIHSIRARTKDRSRLARKLEEHDPSYESLADVHDLVGARIITYFPDQVDGVADVIKSEFEIDWDNSVDKRDLLDPDRFGYLSLHYVAKLDAARLDLAEYRLFAGTRFEIQVRSILQHAWAEIEHDLGYKAELAVPYGIRRRFSRLAGLLEIADAEFASVRDALKDYSTNVEESIRSNPSAVSIDRDSVEHFLKSRVVTEVDAAIAEAVGGSIGSVTYPTTQAVDLQSAGFKTIADVEQALVEHREHVVELARGWISGRGREFQKGISLFYLRYLVVGRTQSYEEAERYVTAANIRPKVGTRSDLARRIVDRVRGILDS